MKGKILTVTDIRKWYRRLMLMVMTGPIAFFIIAAVGFLGGTVTGDFNPRPFQSGSFDDREGFWFFAYILMALFFIGPLILPRIFLFISLGVNCFGLSILVTVIPNPLEDYQNFIHSLLMKNDLAMTHQDMFAYQIMLVLLFCFVSLFLLLPSIGYLYRNNRFVKRWRRHI